MGCSWCKECGDQRTYDVADLSPEWQVTMLFETDYQELFSAQETNTLISRWKYLVENKKSIHFGRTMFAKFFLYAPETQKFFFRERQKGPIRPYDWQRYPLFKSHVRRVINGIDYTISLLHYPDELARHLNRMREVHQRYSNMKLIYGEIFIKTFDATVADALGHLYTHECKIVFRKFLTLLYTEIFHGIDHIESLVPPLA